MSKIYEWILCADRGLRNNVLIRIVSFHWVADWVSFLEFNYIQTNLFILRASHKNEICEYFLNSSHTH